MKKSRPRGRPFLPPEDRKTVVISIRFTKSEISKFTEAAKARGLELKDWIRLKLRFSRWKINS